MRAVFSENHYDRTLAVRAGSIYALDKLDHVELQISASAVSDEGGSKDEEGAISTKSRSSAS